jgi:signal transduction histidine kinase
VRGRAPTVGQVGIEPVISPVQASLRRARAEDRAARRWADVAVTLLLVVVVVTAVHVQPGPGTHGTGLAISVALIGFVAGALSGVLTRDRLPRLQLGAAALLLVSSGALLWLQPRGAEGLLGLTLTCALAARRLRRRPGVLAAVVGVVLLAGTLATVRHRSPLLSLFIGCGIAGACGFVLLVQRLRDANEQAGALLVQLEESRGAQAQAAALAERQRLAREMHDVLAHSLSGLILQLEGARMLAASDPSDPRLPATVQRAHQLAKEGLNEARHAIGLLRDDDLPGPEQLGAVVGQFERDSGIPCSFAMSGEPRSLRPDVRLALYRVTQEALTNVVRHAGPARVEVRLAYGAGRASLTIEDFGAARAAGRPPVTAGRTAVAAGHVAGYGLTGMRERAELLGGTLTADATPSGFQVELRVPA